MFSRTIIFLQKIYPSSGPKLITLIFESLDWTRKERSKGRVTSGRVNRFRVSDSRADYYSSPTYVTRSGRKFTWVKPVPRSTTSMWPEHRKTRLPDDEREPGGGHQLDTSSLLSDCQCPARAVHTYVHTYILVYVSRGLKAAAHRFMQGAAHKRSLFRRGSKRPLSLRLIWFFLSTLFGVRLALRKLRISRNTISSLAINFES